MDRSSRSDGPPRQKTARPRLILALRFLLIFVGLSPFLAALLRPYLSPSSGDVLYLLFSPVCHRKVSRTLVLASELMPICSRCAGIFVGFLLSGFFPWPALSVRRALFYGFVVSVLMVVHVVVQDLGLVPFSHPTRLLTGIVWGHVCGLGVLALVREFRATSSA